MSIEKRDSEVMMKRRVTLAILLLAGAAVAAAQTDLRQIVKDSPELPMRAVELKTQSPRDGWRLGMVSWIAVDRAGLIYLLQRGENADPIVVIDREGHLIRSWGKGMFKMPHAIRIDPVGNIWTTDATTSTVYKFSPNGRKLLTIEVGGQPSLCRAIDDVENGDETPNGFCGTTDIAFAPNGHLFITDGYANARVLEYSRSGKKLRQWGAPGRGPGQFRLVHSIQIDSTGVVYVSDRENGRIQRFKLDGTYLGEWDNLGRIFSLRLSGNALWAATQPLDLPMDSFPSAKGWLLKLDPKTGKVLGHVDATADHGMDAMSNGELFFGPGPDMAAPQWLRPVVTPQKQGK